MNNNETLTIPTGTNREDIKERERIISDVYRRWYEANPTKAVFNTNLNDYINVRFLSINETMPSCGENFSFNTRCPSA